MQRRTSLHAHGLVAVGGERAKNVLGVKGVARLHGDIELGALGRHVEKQAMVIDRQDIGAKLFAEPARGSGHEKYRAGPEW